LARQAADYLERKRSEEIQKTLNYEIQHRANNLLAIVQSIARRTPSGDHTLSQAREAFEARLEAVARANLRLTKSNWSGLDLTEIVQTELKPFYDRVKNEGPIVTLDPQQGQNLALALHELATNAAKYGAFSNASGTVRVFWTIMRGDDGSSLLNFKWQEGGGPPVIVPTRRGFGSKLISATSPNVRFNYLPEGLSCEIGVKLGAEIPPK
jgi:two-component sensor histidine kinase